MRLRSVRIKNYKHISYDKEYILEFRDDSKSLVVLGGPNGYGKTTVFETIELLIKGSITGFEAKLDSQGEDNIGVIANDSSKDIIISGIFEDDGKYVLLNRVYDSANEYSETIYVKECSKAQVDKDGIDSLHQCNFTNDNIVDQEEIEKILGTTSYYFNVGCYISQKDSLRFLQSKYRDRRTEFAKVSDVFGIESIKEKYENIKDVKKKLKEYKSEKINEYNTTIEKKKKEIEKVETLISSLGNDKGIFESLFPGKNYAFDKMEIDTSKDYSIITQDLKNLKLAVVNYKKYEAYIKEKEIEKIMSLDIEHYKGLYYKNCVSEIKAKSEKIELDKKKLIIHSKIQNKQEVTIDELRSIKIPEEVIGKIVEINEEITRVRSQQSVYQESLLSILQIRNQFLEVFDEKKTDAKWEKNTCPFCGQKHNDLLKEISKTNQKFIVEDDKLTKVIIGHNEKREKLYSQIDKSIVAEIGEMQKLIDKASKYMDLLDVLTDDLELSLEKYGIKYKILSNSSEEDKDEFDEFYKGIIRSLNLLSKEKTGMSELEADTIKLTIEKYYDGNEPIHDVAQIDRKLEYINSIYSISLDENMGNLKSEIDQIVQTRDKFEKIISSKINDFDGLATCFNAALEKYQANIIRGICLPVYVYSGRIIQNHPLGLGIYMRQIRNKLMFCTEKSEEDVYNVLSAGQLNGLVISILLAVHKVYGGESKLNMY